MDHTTPHHTTPLRGAEEEPHQADLSYGVLQATIDATIAYSETGSTFNLGALTSNTDKHGLSSDL